MKLLRLARRSGATNGKNSVYGPTTSPRLTRAQRDAVYTITMNRLSAAGDLPMLIERGQVSKARLLGSEMADGLQLVLDGLGWEPEGGEGDVELALPSGQLRRVFSRLRQLAEEERAAKPWEAGDTRPHAALAVSACDQVLELVGPEEPTK